MERCVILVLVSYYCGWNFIKVTAFRATAKILAREGAENYGAGSGEVQGLKGQERRVGFSGRGSPPLPTSYGSGGML